MDQKWHLENGRFLEYRKNTLHSIDYNIWLIYLKKLNGNTDNKGKFGVFFFLILKFRLINLRI